jgi:catechol 2,3-dioxygenase-like lactoylglutathione lyase family enzyme
MTCRSPGRGGSGLTAAKRCINAARIPQEIALIGYVVLGTNDLPRAVSFYDALLAEMGVGRLMEFSGRGYGWAAAMDKPMLCIMKPYDGRPATVGNGVMAGIGVESRDLVDRIHQKALALGGTDEGAPGLRAEGGDGFYAAYFRDLDGNKLDVFCYG